MTLLGELRQPRSVPYRPGLRLTEALALGGGTSEKADEGDVRIVRGNLSEPRVYTASLTALRNGKAGDVIQRLIPLLGVASLATGVVR